MLEHYYKFLEVFLKKGYEFIFFKNLNFKKDNQVVLRHDIDFDTNYALNSAIIESNLGIKATYFFLIKSDFYNILSNNNFDNIKKIRDLGHTISIHFDPTIYKDFELGLKNETQLFSQLFDVKPYIISLHRPNNFFLNHNELINGLMHTYQDVFFKKIKYFADSTGCWRFGDPILSDEFKHNKNMQLLIHPIWWFVTGKSNTDKIKKYFYHRVNNLKNNFYDNSNPFKEIINEIN